jgi:four helix bundle protein
MDYENKLSDRTLYFSKQMVHFCALLPKNATNLILMRQVLRSATSIGANYLEANDPLGEKDFIHRLRIA